MTDISARATEVLNSSEGADSYPAPSQEASPVQAAAVQAAPVQAALSSTSTRVAAAVPRTLDEIEADIDAARQRLAGRLNDLQDYVSPRNVIDRQVSKAKTVFVDEYGGIRPERVAVAIGVVAVLAAISFGRARRRRR